MKNDKKVVIITGASQGIGLETARFLTEKGYTVYGIARRKINGEKFNSIIGDVTNYQSVRNIFPDIFKREGRIDYLINNAGVGIGGAVEHTSNETIDKIFNTNVTAAIRLSRDVIPFMRKSGGGRIIHLGSVAGPVPVPFQACYSAAKAAIENFSAALDLEVRPFNIRACTVIPGDTSSGFTDARIKNQVLSDENYSDRIIKSLNRTEHDERNGMATSAVSNQIYKCMTKKSPPITVAVGFPNKVIVRLAKVFPKRAFMNVVNKLFG